MTQYTCSITPDLLRGALDLEDTPNGVALHRLPSWARAQSYHLQLAIAETQPSGVRVVFRTAATTIELDTVMTVRTYAGLPPSGDVLFNLIVDGNLVAQEPATGGAAGTVRFSGLDDRIKDVEIWLPHDQTVDLKVLRSNAVIEPQPADDRPTWIHYGSSISQGSGAASPSRTWPAIAASALGLDLINLGFGGSALIEPFVARTIRNAPGDVISLDIGINLVNTDVMRLQALTPAVHGFLDTIREGHPSTPLVVISPLYCPIHEDTPGPTALDPTALADGVLRFVATGDPSEQEAGKLTMNVIRDELSRVVKQRSATDQHIHYIDGRDLYGKDDFAQFPLSDELHPVADTHEQIGSRITEVTVWPHSIFAEK